MDVSEEYTRNKLTVKIYADENPESPREWENVGNMICSHPNYMLGDDQFDVTDYEGWDDLKKKLMKEEGAILVLPLSLYDHSGITMSVGVHSGWDSGQVGFIYVTKEMALAQYGEDYTDELLEKVLRDEVVTYDQYLTGDVWGYEVSNPRDGEVIDSCWGLYGLDDVKEEANVVADAFKHPHDAAYAKGASQLHG